MKNTYEGEKHTVSKAQSFQNDNKKILLLHRVSKQLIWFIKSRIYQEFICLTFLYKSACTL